MHICFGTTYIKLSKANHKHTIFIHWSYIYKNLKNEQTDKEQTCLVMMHVKENQSLKMMGQE